MSDQVQTVAGVYAFKLNPRESWALIQRLCEISAVPNTRVNTFNTHLETFLRRYVAGFENVRSVFLGTRPLFGETGITNIEPFSIVFGLHIPNGASLSDIAALRMTMIDNVRELRRVFREHYNLRLDFSAMEPRIFYGHILPNIPIQLNQFD
jgi:hypothetical protein